MQMDFFKPLYKQHKRGAVSAFDPRNPNTWGEYTPQVREVSINDSLTVAYAAYGLENSMQPYTEISFKNLDGLRICANMLSTQLQKALVKEATSTYLADPRHKTHFDAHMQLQRPIKLFEDGEMPAKTLQAKLRWITLGGQYNWTTKVYPSFEKGSDLCPEMPQKLEQFVDNAYGIHADAAIVNYYSEGDILSPHQDVAELTNSDLVSISLGCECVFYIGLHRYDHEPLPIILRSGDVLIMGGQSRWAFHGVGRVFDHTCPLEFEEPLHSYMETKRININIRQMFDRDAQ